MSLLALRIAVSGDKESFLVPTLGLLDLRYNSQQHQASGSRHLNDIISMERKENQFAEQLSLPEYRHRVYYFDELKFRIAKSSTNESWAPSTTKL